MLDSRTYPEGSKTLRARYVEGVLLVYDASGNVIYSVDPLTGILTYVNSASGATVMTIDPTSGLATFAKHMVRFGGEEEDLRFPAQGINPPGLASDPARDSSTGLLNFSGSADNLIAGQAQLPHAWEAGTSVEPHIHFRVAAAHATQNMRWALEWEAATINGDFPSASGTYANSETITVANGNSTTKHQLAAFTAAAMTGITESGCIVWRLSRLANSDPLDDYTGVCTLLEFDLHYRVNKPGKDV